MSDRRRRKRAKDTERRRTTPATTRRSGADGRDTKRDSIDGTMGGVGRDTTLGAARRLQPTTVLGRPEATQPLRPDALLPVDIKEKIRRDITAPPPLLLLPLRLEYRVVEINVPIRLTGNVAAIVGAAPNVAVQPIRPRPAPPRRLPRAKPHFRLDPANVTFQAQRQIWFRWYPDEDFALHGVAPATDGELATLARFDAAITGHTWHALDQPAVVSAWQVLSREMAPERALYLLRHRTESGDPHHLDVIGTIPLLPEKVALFGLFGSGDPVLLGEGSTIDPAVARYSVGNLQQGGWHTDFDAAIKAGMALRLTAPEAVSRALEASWIIAVGVSKQNGTTAMTTLLRDAIANGAFAFVPQDTATNNTPGEPTTYRSSRADLIGFLRTAVDAERGVLASTLTQSVELFAEATGVDVQHVANAPSSGDLAFEDARAMLRVIGPALIDTAVDNTAALKGIDEEEVIAFFEQAVAARGPLPLLRFGKSPYSVLPLVQLDGMTPLASDTDNEKRIETFVRDFAMAVGRESQTAAQATVPVLQPGDPDAERKLEVILKLNPVSRRLEVNTVGFPDARGIGCPYVMSAAHPVLEYLAALASQPLGQLVDPTDSDTEWPLLYRLARLSLMKQTLILAGSKAPAFTNVKISTRVHLTQDEQSKFELASLAVARRSLAALAAERLPVLGPVSGVVQTASGRFLAGLRRLEAIAQEPNGVAKLELLLMETIDLFQHRIDAWATGVAYRRLVKRRRAGRAGLVGGYWGMIGRLRFESVTGRTDGYLQAPSPNQAVTAAILRSAHLRHRDTGAFAIGLDSVRVRRGLKLLEMLQAGLSPGEALGYIGERRLHDRQQDVLVFRLRDLFPIKDPRDDAAIETRLFDGLTFMNTDIGPLVPAGEIMSLQALQADLRREFDALSDLVLAEATHLRAMGRTDAASAWLQVLSGETIPGLPSVVRTRRAGHGSTHRIVVLLELAKAKANDTPRAIAEPALAAEVEARLPTFGAAFVEVKVRGVDGATDITRRFRLEVDLGLKPIDLLVGGEGEIVLRTRHRLLTLWLEDAATQSALGPLPDRDILTFINQTRPVTVSLDAGVRELLRLAAELRHAVAQGRTLEPTDFSAAADPQNRLTDDRERMLLTGAAEVLAVRVSMLVEKVNASLATLRSAAGPLVAAARNHRRLVDTGAEVSALALALVDVAKLRRPVDAALLAVSRFAEPGALRPIATGEMTADPDELDRVLAAIGGRLASKAGALAAALPPSTPPANAAAARIRRDTLVAALRTTLDGDALPVLPPLRRVQETTPLVAKNPPRVAPALDDWRSVRAKVARIAVLFKDNPWRAHATTGAATGADAEDADERADESIAPRSRVFGTFVARDNPAKVGEFVGFMADEWAEQRPSRMQQTGLAINYDSPQSEPPHALLLCEPSGPPALPWSEATAAAMVAEAIGLMKVRALAAQDRPLHAPLFPFANQVPFKQVPGAASKPRIPQRRIRRHPLDEVLEDSVFVVSRTAPEVGLDVGSEVAGFSKAQE